ncbi:hypothetical protein MPTK1_1g11510 [Marchantia polymorpha subsp. ruderalis]|uniref:RING-type E3 ubiquitin transferase n=2 Tax=Marchantia polymorpha TaxID=3197 RepID=A0AAF6AP13_MARPO|nr:hypothetical protein MARPO_0014s0075 [Marchantia polymorpha]BBM98183.1 hypothetical protein Mp_1g11510 [Marchantia polymorpha subsp. ruderalis]|eukprot:PTQ45539.1 hypothetical protein MARPO_0014s0075 [Marchantia polymorpha]
MEDSADLRRGAPLISSSGRQGSCWPSTDMHYQLGGNNYASGSGSNSGSSRLNRMDEANEAWQGGRSCGQDTGKGPECSRTAAHKSSQVSHKVVPSRSSGARRSQRSHNETAAQGQWSALHSFSGSIDESGLGNMDTDTNLGIGLSTRLGLSEVPTLVGHGRAATGQDFSLGRSGISTSRNSDLYPGRISGHSIVGQEYTPSRGSGQGGDRLGTTRGSGSTGLPLASRSSLLGSSVTYHSHAHRSALDEGRIGDSSQGIAMTSSLLTDRHGIDGQPLHPGSSSICNSLSDPFMAGASSSHNSSGEEAACSSDSHFVLSSASVDRAQGAENQSSKGGILGNSLSNSSSSYKNVMNSSRGSACKRKSCTPGLLASSCRSASPHSSGSREGYATRTMGGSSTGRRSSGNLGCASASSVVATASSVAAGRCAETSVSASALDEPRSRKGSTSRDVESGAQRAGKSLIGSGSAGSMGPRSMRSSGSIGGNLEQLSSPSQPPFARTVRRAIPALPDTWCSRRVILADCSTDTDFTTAGGSTIVRSTEQLMSTGGGRRSGSPLVASSRSGSTSSPRRNDNHFGSSALGERLPHRYLGSNTRSLTTGSSSPGSFGGIGSESRLRLRNLSNSSVDAISNPANAAAQSQGTQSTQQGATNLGVTSVPSPSRLPPHPPVVRSRHSHSSSSAPMLIPASSGPAPSRLPPSPPSVSSSLSTALEMLPSGSSIFQSSFLPRTSSSVESRNERGLASAAESLLGMPFRGLQSPSDGEHQPRLVAEGLAEILLALERVERDEDLTYEQLLMLEATLLFGGMGLHDQHSDLRLDVDNMSYEELLALEERIGNVSTGLNPDMVNKRLKRSKYSSQAVAVSSCSQESDIKCSICQEEYEEGDDLGKIDCGHSYHVACIKQWLLQKNQCPICKASALS